MNIQCGEAPFLSEGLEVSAKFKGAFCEAKIKRIVKKDVKINVLLKEAPFGSSVIEPECIVSGSCEVNQNVIIKLKDRNIKAAIRQIRDFSRYWVEFDDGDEKELSRNQVKLKGKKHFEGEINMDEMPLNNPDKLKIDAKNENGEELGRTKSDRACRGGSIMSSRSRTPLSNDNNCIDSKIEKIKNGSKNLATTNTSTRNATDNKYFPFDLGTIDNFTVGRVVLSLGKENDFSRAAPSVIVSLKAYKAFSTNLKVPTEDNEIPLISFVTSKFFIAQQDTLRPFNGKCLEYLPTPSVFLKSAYSKAQAFLDNGELPKGIEQQWVFYKEKKISSSKKKEKVNLRDDDKGIKKNGQDKKESKGIDKNMNLKLQENEKSNNVKKNSTQSTISKESTANGLEVEEKRDFVSFVGSEKTPSTASYSSSDDEEEMDMKEYLEKKDNFTARFFSYAGNICQNFIELPIIRSDEVLDIYKLTRTIVKLGGTRIRTNNKWPIVYKKMHLDNSNLSLTELVQFYDKYLHGFLKVNKNLGWSAADSCKDSYGFTKRRTSNLIEKKITSPMSPELPSSTDTSSKPKKRGRKPKDKTINNIAPIEVSQNIIDTSSELIKDVSDLNDRKSPQINSTKINNENCINRPLKRERTKSESGGLHCDEDNMHNKRKYPKRKCREESELRERSDSRNSHEKSIEKDKTDVVGRGKSELGDNYCNANIFTMFNVGQKMLGFADDSYWDLRILSFEQPEKKALVRRIKEICGPDMVFNKLQKKLLKGVMSNMSCFVHYLRWNSRYDEHLGLDRIYLLKSDQATFESQFSESIPENLMKEIVEWCNSSDGIKSVKYTCYESDDEDDKKLDLHDKPTDSSISSTTIDLTCKEDINDPKFLDSSINNMQITNELVIKKDINETVEEVASKQKEVVLKDFDIIKDPQIYSCGYFSHIEKQSLKETVFFTCNESQEIDSSETVDDLALECSELFDGSPDLEDLGNDRSSLQSQLKSAIRKKAKRLNQYIPSEIRKRRLQNPQFDENEELIYECAEPCVKALLRKYDEPVTEDYLKLVTSMSDDDEFSEIDEFLNNESLPTTKDIEEIQFDKDIITEKLGILRQYYTKNWLDLEEEDDRIMKYLFEKDIAAHRKRKQHGDSPSCQAFEKIMEEERLDKRSQENALLFLSSSSQELEVYIC
ncbi:ARID/BRIGHT DNA-binding domain and Chromo domain-like-containing protein [Strongyloides ratti]|uniref:ARID/BRIGHT DNA-binding domain and Chromo domain-like-containing protein n=1 Tax=Strongyloides ratti TaxID=34506 RepID=A0A090LAZ1_STRRB|nr:ARID/BRIGHT DNA-binding domain and Chromo domain-like-containing protein [Strongyloides ratti]CEF66961.1 ARID/BRIGHT DNA-binding domain and Chromo domain-like-containing protein [Strongyloides ratti]